MKIQLIKKYKCKCGNYRYPHERMRKKDLHGRADFDEYNIDLKNMKFCCEDMGAEFSDMRFCNFKVGDENGKPYFYFDSNLDEWAVNGGDNLSISYCPYCGEKILFIINEQTYEKM